ncbi:D-glycero-beta-D-manno-heptose 1-phosphate adenylyltransferase [bacterium]|jgi:D-glycero-beta-D-manno-heptose 1-phosphate adenylyltransferase|nr:D-glycero-beta-D-manno-heptose 1-phosphate adenylyltransferase [bacterium]
MIEGAFSLEETKDLREYCRDKSLKVVFTNGCFDILHVGHVTYLEEARALGDVLIVGMNTDTSVKTNKGPDRPINTDSDRAKVLGSLRAVDAVVLFDDKTPMALIEALQPDIHVKGGDYEAEALPEYPVVTAYGGEVQILSFVTGHSTSNLIQKINTL